MCSEAERVNGRMDIAQARAKDISLVQGGDGNLEQKITELRLELMGLREENDRLRTKLNRRYQR